MQLRLPFMSRKPLIAVIRLQGIIASGNPARLNDITLAPMIEKAFRRGKPAAVALLLNSPGGSPVQSSLIAARIRRLADERGIPVYAFVEDVAASGGYWLATAADEIYADPNSIVGSIGVISAGFGFDKFIGRYGIERRVYTAGESKSMLDPFRPERDEDVERLKELQTQIHDNFKDQVRGRRGAKLAEDPRLFTGEFWVGKRAADMGLVDGIGHLVPMMKERFGKDVRFTSYKQKRPFLSRFGRAMAAEAVAGVEDHAAWARFGL
ncbi:serine protease SohB [Palleronia marisminoris]|uniref:Putative protease SohB n=1 Tax=Palleronia marisminoris TaxID=315423 RepID=A0A1Y5TLJ1_9RHOB|nr:S49 family peptidase [Palleronia marisminoris]SFH43704.1 serine protease SohB [Palleronia marisminoris]SLN66774.1 putative protease SohB [Palleronia marisminoris]